MKNKESESWKVEDIIKGVKENFPFMFSHKEIDISKSEREGVFLLPLSSKEFKDILDNINDLSFLKNRLRYEIKAERIRSIEKRIEEINARPEITDEPYPLDA